MSFKGLKTIYDYVRYTIKLLKMHDAVLGQGTAQYQDEALWLIAGSCGLDPDEWEAFIHCRVTHEEKKLLEKRIEQRVKHHVPVAYLLGEAWFAGLKFVVDESVLIPRSPFAELIEQQFSPWLQAGPSRILDLCTGSGCIGIATALQFDSSEVDLLDISQDALRLAKQNVDRYGLADRVNCIESNGFSATKHEYDLIVSNPPYVGEPEMAQLPAEFLNEPELALVSGQDGLDLVIQILADAPGFMAENALLFIEVGYSESAFNAVFPDLPVVWLEFEMGGSGVFQIDKNLLLTHRETILYELDKRQLKLTSE